MYSVNNKEFTSFLAAIKYAKEIQGKVMQGDICRWQPAGKVDAKKMKMYRERLAVWELQERLKRGE